jgi:MscS family membrane protein
MAHSKSWEDLEAVKTDVNLKLMAILKQRGVEVAFPTRTLHLESHVAHEAQAAELPGDSEIG